MALAAVLPAQPEGAKLMLRKDLGQGRVAEVYAVDVPVDEVYRGPTPEQEEELRKDAERHGRKYSPLPKPRSANWTELYVIEDHKRRLLWQQPHIYEVVQYGTTPDLGGYKVFDVCAVKNECLVLVGCGRLDNARTNQHPASEGIKNSYSITTAPIKGRFYSISPACIPSPDRRWTASAFCLCWPRGRYCGG